MPRSRWMKYSDLPHAKARSGVCRWCGEACPGRRTKWCSETCVREYRIRSHNGFVRASVRKRDKGICSECGLDTYKLRREIRKLPWDTACQRIAELEQQGFIGCFQGPWVQKSLWEADHIVTVKDGGGWCGLDNYRTLCVACHKKRSADSRRT